MTDKDIFNYRLLLLIKPDVSEAEYQAVVDAVCSQIEKEKGSVKEKDLWGSRPLAYRIHSYDKGYYAHLHIVLSVSGVNSLDQSLRLDENIIRYMITKD